MNFLGHFFGVLGILINIIIYQQQSKKSILFFKLLSDVIWMVHFLLISAFSGAAVAFVGIIRESVFLFVEKKREKWFVLFLAVSFISSYLTYKNMFSILPAVASAFSVISFWQKNPLTTKYLSFPIATCMGVYGFASGSVSGVCNEVLTVISSLISIVFHRKEMKK